MQKLVWFVLNDGRSLVAGCDAATKDSLDRMLAEPDHTLTLTSDDSVERIPSSAVRDFVLFEAKSKVPPATAIYRLLQL
jgi:hypothetical protein